jgi:hypothetical protein
MDLLDSEDPAALSPKDLAALSSWSQDGVVH